MKKFINIITLVLVWVLVIDFIGFLFWGFSGQFPTDGFYIGTITRSVLTAIF